MSQAKARKSIRTENRLNIGERPTPNSGISSTGSCVGVGDGLLFPPEEACGVLVGGMVGFGVLVTGTGVLVAVGTGVSSTTIGVGVNVEPA